jgi:hypothetical protein
MWTENFCSWAVTEEIYTFVTGLMRGSLEGPISNLGRRYVIVRLELCLSTSGNMLEIVR